MKKKGSQTMATVGFGERLYQIMQQQNISVQELSRQSGLSRMGIYMMLNRRPSGIRFDTLQRLCQVLKVDPNTLLEYSEKKNGN